MTVIRIPRRPRHTFGAAVLLFGLILIFTGCQTTGPGIPDGFGSPFAGGRPSWIDEYPADPAYYIGIGSSKTGNQNDDMEAARAKAMASLASTISTQIRSETLITAREDSEGEAYQSAEQIIRETVDQNIREVEVADSYYSEEDGYWFYLRLNKAVWARIQTEEMDRLERRVRSLTEPDLTDDAVSVATRLGSLWKGWELLSDSPYAGLIETDLAGDQGVLIDLLEGFMIEYIDGLAIRFAAETAYAKAGASVPVDLEVRNGHSLRTGSVRVFLGSVDEDPAASIVTDDDGRYSGEIDFGSLPPGRTRMRATIDFGTLGLDLERIPRRFFLPERDFAVELSQIEARLSVVLPEDSPLVGVDDSFASLISDQYPVQFSTDSIYVINVDVLFRNAPANEYGLLIVHCKAQVSVSRDGSTLAAYETEEIKDGGLTVEQAQARSFGKLIEFLEGSGEIAEVLEKAFSIE